MILDLNLLTWPEKKNLVSTAFLTHDDEMIKCNKMNICSFENA